MTIINLSKLKKIATSSTVDPTLTERLTFNNSIYATEFHGKNIHATAFHGKADSLTLTDAGYTIKQYVDSRIEGLDPKQSVKVATVSNLPTLAGTPTIDGVSVVVGDRVLVKNQANAYNNGIYIVSNTSWTRSDDMNAWSEVPSSYVFVERGDTNANTGWTCTSDQGKVIGAADASINWVQFTGVGTIKGTNGNISVNSNTVDLVPTLTSVSTSVTVNSASTITPLTIDKYGRVTATGTVVNIAPAWANIDGKPTSLVHNNTATTFTAKVTFDVTSTTNASINIPASSSNPTTPSSGDIWYNTNYSISSGTSTPYSISTLLFNNGSYNHIVPSIGIANYSKDGFLKFARISTSGTLGWELDTTEYAPLVNPTFTNNVTINGAFTANNNAILIGNSNDANSSIKIGCGNNVVGNTSDKKFIAIGNNGNPGTATEIYIGNGVGGTSVTAQSSTVTTNIGTNAYYGATSTVNIGKHVSGDNDNGIYLINIGNSTGGCSTNINGQLKLTGLTTTSENLPYVLAIDKGTDTVGYLQNVAVAKNWTVISNTHTAVSRDRILANTSTAPFTITLPPSPSVGDDVYIADMSGTFGSNSLTINAGASMLMGINQDLVLDVDNQGAILVYSGSTRGWVVL